jgi:hypothetical protein
MGRSTDGQFSYGCVFEEGFEFPWDDEKYDGEIEEWWMDVLGFVNNVESPYDEAGNYKPGFNSRSPEIGKFFQSRREWLKDNPIPVELVNYCSGDYPMYLLASKSITASRGGPTKVSQDFMLNAVTAHAQLTDFLTTYSIDYDPDQVGWWLSSYCD